MASANEQTLTSHSKTAVGLRSPASNFGAVCEPDAFDTAVRVMELGQLDRVMWDVNILFAQGRVEEIRSKAKELQQKGQEVGFEIAIALFRLEGKKSDFEDMAVDYAVQTGNSPPMWLDAHDKHDLQENLDVAPKRMLVKILSLLAENIIETTIKMESPWPLTLDFGEVIGLDLPGLDIFQESLTGRIYRKESTVLVNIEKLLTSITHKIRSANYHGNAGLWTFCLNAHRLTGNRLGFDELAADFVEKTGDDMPVWLDLRDPHDVLKNTQAAPMQAVTGFVVGDCLSMVCPRLLNKIYPCEGFKSAQRIGHAFSLDFRDITRWTINDMSGVLGLVRQLERDTFPFVFINLNELLLSLFKGFGIDKKIKLVVAGGTT